jgi:hypothetical protein
LGVALVWGLAAAGAEAQPRERPARAREELFKMVDAYIVSNLQESLGASPTSSSRGCCRW